MSLDRQHSFWGSLSPLGGLTGAGLLVMASARLSWAVTAAGGLLCVYGLTTLAYFLLSSVIPENFFPKQGKTAVFACIASFWSCIYIFLFWLLSPYAVMEVFVLLLLIPLYCASTGIEKFESSGISENVAGALSQAGVLICLMILFSIIREPLSYCCLSFPGSQHGMMTIMYFNENAFFPIGIFSSSAGALLILGYVVCLYQYTKSFIISG